MTSPGRSVWTRMTPEERSRRARELSLLRWSQFPTPAQRRRAARPLLHGLRARWQRTRQQRRRQIALGVVCYHQPPHDLDAARANVEELLAFVDGRIDRGELLQQDLERDVGHAAVSRAMNGKGVRPETLEKIARNADAAADVRDRAVHGADLLHKHAIAHAAGRNPAHERRRAAILATVKGKFSNDPVRTVVANRLEREHMTIDAYARAVPIRKQSLIWWLTGKLQGLEENSLRAIIKYEGLNVSKRWIKTHSAEASWHRHIMGLHRKWGRRKKPVRRSSHHRQALAEGKRRLWNDPKWRSGTKAATILAALSNSQNAMRMDEEKYLPYLIRLAVGKFRSQHRTAVPADVLRVLSRIALQHRRKFPDSAMKLEDIPERIDKEMGESVHALLRAGGHPVDAKEIARFVRVLAEEPSRTWEEISAVLHGPEGDPETPRQLWRRLRRELSRDHLHRLIEAILGPAASPASSETTLQRPLGRPTKKAIAPA